MCGILGSLELASALTVSPSKESQAGGLKENEEASVSLTGIYERKEQDSVRKERGNREKR